MRLLIVIGLVALAAGCGGTTDDAPRAGGTTGPVAAEPSTPAPELDASLGSGPPPAWLATPASSFWLGYSSYCWDRECADFIAPSCADRKRTPKIAVGRGETATVHLGFDPVEVTLTFLDGAGRTGGKAQKLAPSRTPSWQVERDGPFSLFARAKGRDASYVACIELA